MKKWLPNTFFNSYFNAVLLISPSVDAILTIKELNGESTVQDDLMDFSYVSVSSASGLAGQGPDQVEAI